LQTITKLWLWTITILTITSIMTLIAQTIDLSQLSLHPSACCCDDLVWVQFSHILLGFYWFVQFNQFLLSCFQGCCHCWTWKTWVLTPACCNLPGTGSKSHNWSLCISS
jgi:hypothetical protein